ALHRAVHLQRRTDRQSSDPNGRGKLREDDVQARVTCVVVTFLLLAPSAAAFAQVGAPQVGTPAVPAIEALRVVSANDRGEGTLRWAIERSNAAPGRYRIEIDPAGQASHVIKP